MSHGISKVMITVGILVMGIGLQLIVGGFAIIEFTDIIKEHPPELKDEVGTLLELRKQIQILLQKQSFELTRSEGLSWAGTGAALLIAGFPLVIIGRKELNDFARAKNFLEDDFKTLHYKILTVTTTLEAAIKDLKTNGAIVNNLINEKSRPSDFMRNFVAGLFFSLWDSIVDQLKHFTKDEQKILKTLHDFILNSNGIIAPRESLLISEIEEILKRNPANIVNELKEKILNGFETNLHDYRLIYNRMHHELDSIKWIKNQNWSKKIESPLTMKMIVDKKGTFWYE